MGVLGRRVVALRDTPTTTLFACLADGTPSPVPKATAEDEVRRELHDYFQLDVPLPPLYESWSQSDRRLKVRHRILLVG